MKKMEELKDCFAEYLNEKCLWEDFEDFCEEHGNEAGKEFCSEGKENE